MPRYPMRLNFIAKNIIKLPSRSHRITGRMVNSYLVHERIGLKWPPKTQKQVKVTDLKSCLRFYHNTHSGNLAILGRIGNEYFCTQGWRTGRTITLCYYYGLTLERHMVLLDDTHMACMQYRSLLLIPYVWQI